MANQSSFVMNCFLCGSASLALALGTACKSVPRDECGKPLPPAPAPVFTPRFVANVEPRSFLGIAVDSATKARLAGVSFYVEDLRIGANSDSLGIARLRDLPLGPHRIAIRRIGYEQRRDSIQVSAVSGTVGVYELPRRRVQLCQTIITS